MTVQDFYEFIKERNATDAEMRLILDDSNPFAKGVIINKYMVDIRYAVGKHGEVSECEVVIGY